MKFSFLSKTPVAHRGLHGANVPENSLAAFTAAKEAGYAVETDVRLTKDGALVLFHDDDLNRMCGVDKKVIDCTLAQLQTLTLRGTQEKIPLLTDLLRRIQGEVPILLEIKNVDGANQTEYVRKIAKAFEGYCGEYAVQSFQPMLVKRYKKRCPEIACGVLASARSSKQDYGNSPLWRMKASIVKNMSLNFWVKPDFISYCAQDLPQRVTEKFKKTRLAWTVRSEKEADTVAPYAENIIFEGFLPKLPE